MSEQTNTTETALAPLAVVATWEELSFNKEPHAEYERLLSKLQDFMHEEVRTQAGWFTSLQSVGGSCLVFSVKRKEKDFRVTIGTEKEGCVSLESSYCSDSFPETICNMQAFEDALLKLLTRLKTETD